MFSIAPQTLFGSRLCRVLGKSGAAPREPPNFMTPTRDAFIIQIRVETNSFLETRRRIFLAGRPFLNVKLTDRGSYETIFPLFFVGHSFS